MKHLNNVTDLPGTYGNMFDTVLAGGVKVVDQLFGADVRVTPAVRQHAVNVGMFDLETSAEFIDFVYDRLLTPAVSLADRTDSRGKTIAVDFNHDQFSFATV